MRNATILPSSDAVPVQSTPVPKTRMRNAILLINDKGRTGERAIIFFYFLMEAIKIRQFMQNS